MNTFIGPVLEGQYYDITKHNYNNYRQNIKTQLQLMPSPPIVKRLFYGTMSDIISYINYNYQPDE